MGDRKSELLTEVSQIIAQYRQEVPGRRRAWPESIKNRVLELQRMGFERSDIAKGTGISYFTIFNWGEAKAPRFEPVAIVPSRRALPKAATVTVTKCRRRHRPSCRPALTTVTVTMPGGIRIEGVTVEVLLKLLPQLSGGIA